MQEETSKDDVLVCELGENYYEMVASQRECEVKRKLNEVAFDLCYQNEITERAKQDFLRQHEALVTLRTRFALLDRELAKLDGRHKQIEPRDRVAKRERKVKRKQKARVSASQLKDLLSPEQKKALVEELMKGL